MIERPASGGPHAFLRLLCALRWLAVGCQALTLLIVTRWMGVALPLPPLWGAVAVLALFAAFATWRSRSAVAPLPGELFAHLCVDIIVLAWLVAWSGGIENPFASLFLLPIALSILALPQGWVWAVAVCATLGYGLSAAFGRPLPHVHGAMGDAFNLHKAGMLVNFLLSATVMLVFFARLAAARRARERELASLRERFVRNEGILALATHAASVAHELNTPLGTLTLLVDDMVEQAPPGQQREELLTMKQIIGQCRDRVRQLASPAQGRGGDPVSLEEVIDRWQLVRPAVELVRSGSLAEQGHVDAAVGHLLQALLNNAADASEQSGRRRVDLRLDARDGMLHGEIRDYGVGFDQASPALPGTLFRTSKPDGLGIGLALSHATVERLGGELSMQATAEGSGVRVLFRLPVTAPA
jgi:two-component system sensor histidine kinase RegB